LILKTQSLENHDEVRLVVATDSNVLSCVNRLRRANPRTAKPPMSRGWTSNSRHSSIICCSASFNSRSMSTPE
jgi:hypothetical protein